MVYENGRCEHYNLPDWAEPKFKIDNGGTGEACPKETNNTLIAVSDFSVPLSSLHSTNAENGCVRKHRKTAVNPS